MEFVDPYEFMRRFRDSMRWVLEDLLKGDVGIFTANFRVPRARVLDKGDRYIYEVELPGVGKGDITVEVVEDALLVKAERHRKVRKGKAEREEHISYSTALPAFPDGDYRKAKARLKNGLLVIEVPKHTRKGGKRIKVE